MLFATSVVLVLRVANSRCKRMVPLPIFIIDNAVWVCGQMGGDPILLYISWLAVGSWDPKYQNHCFLIKKPNVIRTKICLNFLKI